MERVYAFTDEYGNFGWDLENPDVASVFIISAVIVKESGLDVLRQQAEIVRKKYFQTGEMKSSKIGNGYNRRKRILSELLPFQVFSVIVQKSDLLDAEGLRHNMIKK